MLTGHQEGQCVIGLEADCGVLDAQLLGQQIPEACGVVAQ